MLEPRFITTMNFQLKEGKCYLEVRLAFLGIKEVRDTSNIF